MHMNLKYSVLLVMIVVPLLAMENENNHQSSVEQYKQDVADLFKKIIIPRHDMLMEYYENKEFKDGLQKISYMELLNVFNNHTFYQTNDLSQKELKDLITDLISSGRTYYDIYARSKYSDSVDIQIFNKLFKEITKLAQQANISLDTLLDHTYTKPRPLYQTILEKYKTMSNEELETLREFFKSTSKSLLKKDENCQYLVDIANTLRKVSDYTTIVSLGQSPSYWVITAQILDALENKNPERYSFIALSSAPDQERRKLNNLIWEKHNIDLSKWQQFLKLSPNKFLSSLYHNYLASNGITEKSSLLICEQLETGFGLQSFLSLIPTNNYGLYLNIFGEPYNDIGFKLFPELKKKLVYSFTTDNKEQRSLLDELAARDDERIRLVAKFPPEAWPFADPNTFEPSKEAEYNLLRIVDYIMTTITLEESGSKFNEQTNILRLNESNAPAELYIAKNLKSSLGKYLDKNFQTYYIQQDYTLKNKPIVLPNDKAYKIFSEQFNKDKDVEFDKKTFIKHLIAYPEDVTYIDSNNKYSITKTIVEDQPFYIKIYLDSQKKEFSNKNKNIKSEYDLLEKQFFSKKKE